MEHVEVSIRLDGLGSGTVAVDGHNIENLITPAITVINAPDAAPRVVIELTGCIAVDATGDVELTTEQALLLVGLGWTPPPAPRPLAEANISDGGTQ